MNRLILTLVAISAILVKINAQCSVTANCPAPGTVCAVGESELAQGGFCQEANGDAACKAHCEKTYGGELVSAACSAERANKQKECVYSLKCANGGCWGDPHCWTWDGTLFSYQTLQKYHVLKPKTPCKTIPKFEIIQSNHPWQGSSAATLDTLNFIVNDWGQDVQVVAPVNQAFVITVNGKPVTIPHRFSEIKGHRENFIDLKYSDATRLVITTSFGIAVTVHSNGAYSDVSVNIPRHPELKGNTFGLLSSWNDNPADDNQDAEGKAQDLGGTYGNAVAYGNSFLVPGQKVPTQAELDEDKKNHEEHIRTFNKEHWEHLKKMCEANMAHGEMKHCMKQLGRPAHLVEDCAFDLSHIIEEADQHAFLKAKVDQFKKECKHHQLEYTHHKRPSHIPNHKPVGCPEHRRKHHEDVENRRRRPRPDGDDDDNGGRRRRPDGDDEGRRRRPRPDGDDDEGRPEHHGRRPGGDDEGRRPGGRRQHSFLPHHKWGPAKPEHKDRCFKAKEHFKTQSVKLIECLAHEGWFEEEN